MSERRGLGEPGPVPIRQLDLSGRERRLRGAVAAMERIAAGFARAARRSMPFLVRYRAQVVAGPVEIVQASANATALGGTPSWTTWLLSSDGGARASVQLSSDAIALVLEGALGGRGAFWRSPLSPELSAAQRALVERVAETLAADYAGLLRAEVGLEMRVADDDAMDDAEERVDLLRVCCPIDGLPVPAAIVIAASAQAIEAAAREQSSEGPVQGDPRMADALREVSVPVVAELGRVTLGLERVLSLRVGEVIRLTTATDDAVTIRVGGIPKLAGSPVVSRGQLSVEIRDRHEP